MVYKDVTNQYMHIELLIIKTSLRRYHTQNYSLGLVFELVTFLTILSSPGYNQHLLIPSPNQQ